MPTGRTVSKFIRCYVDGYDVSGYARSVGTLVETYDEADATTYGDSVHGYLPNHAAVNLGTLNTVLDNSSGASHALLQSQAKRTVAIAIGIQAAPAQGDPVFCGVFMQQAHTHELSDGIVTISAPFSGWAADAATLAYSKPWGVLLAPKAAYTAVNTAAGVDDRGAQTTSGGYMCYHLLSSNGTVNLKVQDAATNTDVSFTDLVTSGLIDASVTPQHGIVALSNTATVKRYLRWQLAFGTATTATFVIAFVRV